MKTSRRMGEVHTCRPGRRLACSPPSFGSGPPPLRPGRNSRRTSGAVALRGLQKLYHRQLTVYRCLPNTKRGRGAQGKAQEGGTTTPDQWKKQVQSSQSRVSSSIQRNKEGKRKTEKKNSHTENTHTSMC